MYKICFLSLTSQYFAWLIIACKLGTLSLKDRLCKTYIYLNLKRLHWAENNFCGHKCRHTEDPLKQEKEVDEELFLARPPFKGRSVVVQDRQVLTLLPLLNVGALRAPIRLSGPPIPAYWEPHFSPQPGITSPCPRDAVGYSFPDSPGPFPACPHGDPLWLLAPWHYEPLMASNIITLNVFL